MPSWPLMDGRAELGQAGHGSHLLQLWIGVEVGGMGLGKSESLGL